MTSIAEGFVNGPWAEAVRPFFYNRLMSGMVYGLIGVALLFGACLVVAFFKLTRVIASMRDESRVQAEQHRLSASQTQTENLLVLQRQVTDGVQLMHAQLESMRTSMGEQLLHLRGTVNEQLGGNNTVIMQVKSELGGLQQAARHMQDLGKEVASLHDILKAPKLRGNLGELLLEEILKQVLPTASFEMQYRLGDTAGTSVIVDAVIRLGERLVPIDSKFPLESFQRLLECQTDSERPRLRKTFNDVVKKHIDAIADKYIRPQQGTYEFALMYLPAENLYYEAVVREEGQMGQDAELSSIVSYAAKRRVVPVSPNTLYAYLLTIAYGLKGLQIERQAEAMRGEIAKFQQKFGLFYRVFEKVGRNLDLAQRQYDEASRRATKLNDHVSQITGHADELQEDEASDNTLVELNSANHAGNPAALHALASVDEPSRRLSHLSIRSP